MAGKVANGSLAVRCGEFARFPEHAVEQNATSNLKERTFKRSAFETFRASGITDELGSATPHDRTARIVPGAGEEAMKIPLAEPAPGAADAAARESPASATP